MMGKNHLIVGTAATVAGISWVGVLADGASSPAVFLDSKVSWLLGLWPSWLGGIGEGAAWVVSPVSTLAQSLVNWTVPVDLLSVWGALYVLLAVVLFWVGSLLPDIDSKTSMLGRHFHVPGPHHGITHTNWFLAVLLALSLPGFTRVLFWLFLGALLHCLVDGLSKAGRVGFYPLTKHKLITFPDGTPCVVKAGNHLSLYKVGEISETLVLVAALALCVASVWAAVVL